MLDKQAFYKKLLKLDRAGGHIFPVSFNTNLANSSMRYADLSKPIAERLAKVVGWGDPKEWLKSKADRFAEYKHILGTPKADDFVNGYGAYLMRVMDKDPKYKTWMSRLARLRDRKNNPIIKLTPAEEEISKQYGSIYNTPEVQQLSDKVDEIKSMSGIIPTLTEYRSNRPFVSTHHMANLEASSRAAKLAESSPGPDGLIPSVTSGPTYKNYYNKNHRINSSDAPPRTQKELDEYWNDKELVENSPDYEATFSSNYPNAKSIYVRPNSFVNSELGITDDQVAEAAKLGLTARTLQSMDRSAVYKGRRVANHMPAIKVLEESSMAPIRPILDIMPDAKKRHLQKMLLSAFHGRVDGNADTRWYAPLSHMAGGYAFDDFDAPLVKLHGEQVARLRNLYNANVQSFRDSVSNAEQAVRRWVNGLPVSADSLYNILRKNAIKSNIHARINKTIADPNVPLTDSMRSLQYINHLENK